MINPIALTTQIATAWMQASATSFNLALSWQTATQSSFQAFTPANKIKTDSMSRLKEIADDPLGLYKGSTRKMRTSFIDSLGDDSYCAFIDMGLKNYAALERLMQQAYQQLISEAAEHARFQFKPHEQIQQRIYMKKALANTQKRLATILVDILTKSPKEIGLHIKGLQQNGIQVQWRTSEGDIRALDTGPLSIDTMILSSTFGKFLQTDQEVHTTDPYTDIQPEQP